jgi:hypothetical protein
MGIRLSIHMFTYQVLGSKRLPEIAKTYPYFGTLIVDRQRLRSNDQMLWQHAPPSCMGSLNRRLAAAIALFD